MQPQTIKSHTIAHYSDGTDNNFNLIRILCAWGVLVAHSYELAKMKPSIVDPFYVLTNIQMGTFCVCIFFMISGFLITRSISRSRSIKRYAISRCLRIFPALIVILITSTMILGPLVTHLSVTHYFSHPDTWLYLSNINLLDTEVQFHLPGVFTDNPFPNGVNGSLWTLPFEAWMYVLTALIFLSVNGTFAKLLRNPIIEKVVIIFALIMATILFQQLRTPQDKAELIIILSFFVGAIFYVYRQYIRLNVLTLIGVLNLIYLTKETYLQPIIFTAAFSYTVFYLAYKPKGIIRGYNRMGDYSYGLYIYTFPIQQTLAYMDPNISFYKMVILSTVISLIFSIASWHLIEKHALSLQR